MNLLAMKVLAILLLAIVASNKSFAAKIAMLPQFGRSHYLVMSKLASELLSRGHKVSILLGEEAVYAIGKPNVKTFKINEEDKKKNDELVEKITKNKSGNFLVEVSALFEIQKNYCDMFLSNKEMVDEVKGSDVLIGDALYPCSSLVADKFDIPHVVINMNSLSAPFQQLYGIYSKPAYVPQMKSALSSNKMGFLNRMKNLGYFLVNVFVVETIIFPVYEELKLKHDIKPHKSIKESMAKVEMILLERDYIMDNAEPVMPYVREVGSFLPAPAKALPAELEEFMQGSDDHGVILVSFGSMVDTLNDDVVKAMNDAFSKVPQKVLWRLKSGSVKLSSNVKTVNWLPQNDILGHEKIKLFITHAGANGLAEAAYHGVPMICSPFFGDQIENAQFANDAGIAEILSVNEATSEQLASLLTKVMNTKSYKEKASHISKAMRMRPRAPEKEAADVVEYVQALRNLDHLKPRGLNLPFYQLYMLDVIFVILLAVVLVLFALKALLGFVVKLCCRGGTKKLKMS